MQGRLSFKENENSTLLRSQIRLGEWDVHTDTEFHPNLEMDILSVRYIVHSLTKTKTREMDILSVRYIVRSLTLHNEVCSCVLCSLMFGITICIWTW